MLLGAVGPTAALESLVDFGPNPGALEARVHVPSDLEPGAPLVVALHGCTQEAAAFDDETGLTALADSAPFVLLLPQQTTVNNAQACFNWFQRGDNRPGAGESASLRSMIQHVATTSDVDPARIYVLGLSAGGSMTAVLLANYPDLFAGGAIIAGTPFECNRPAGAFDFIWWWSNTLFGEAASATAACGLLGNTPTDRAAEDWGAAVREVAETLPAAWPVVSLWQGDADTVVAPANQDELLKQWTDVHGIDAAADTTQVSGEVIREVFMDGAGVARVETWRLASFPHAVPIDPEPPEACGVAAPFIEDAGVCAVRRIAAFWGLTP